MINESGTEDIGSVTNLNTTKTRVHHVQRMRELLIFQGNIFNLLVVDIEVLV